MSWFMYCPNTVKEFSESSEICWYTLYPHKEHESTEKLALLLYF